MKLLRTLSPLALLALAGCLSFGEKPPPTLMTLEPAAPVAAGPALVSREGTSVTVYVPQQPPELGGLRVPVRTGPGQVAYLQGARWADTPARLFRDVVSETIRTRTGRVALDPRQYVLSPGLRLSGVLSDFGLDATANQVVATYDASLVRKDGGPLESRRFQARTPVAAQDASSVAAALAQATNQIAGEVADWIGPA